MAKERGEERQQQQGQVGQNQEGQIQQGSTEQRSEGEGGAETVKSADSGARNTQGNLGTTQRDWSVKTPQEMGEDG